MKFAEYLKEKNVNSYEFASEIRKEKNIDCFRSILALSCEVIIPIFAARSIYKITDGKVLISDIYNIPKIENELLNYISFTEAIDCIRQKEKLTTYEVTNLLKGKEIFSKKNKYHSVTIFNKKEILNSNINSERKYIDSSQIDNKISEQKVEIEAMKNIMNSLIKESQSTNSKLNYITTVLQKITT